MKDHFGSEALHRKWKLYLILDRHGYGFFLKNVKPSIVLFTTKSLITKDQKNLNKILMEVNFSFMVKELCLDILHKTKSVSRIKINTVFMNLHS